MCDDDMDGDGAHNDEDNCPTKPNPEQVDRDGDGSGDSCDNCPKDKNPDQTDENQNFIGDICETGKDDDGDGFYGINRPLLSLISDLMASFAGNGDNCPHVPNYDQQDIDNDGGVRSIYTLSNIPSYLPPFNPPLNTNYPSCHMQL